MTISIEIEQQIRDYCRQEIRGIQPVSKYEANNLWFKYAVDYIRIYDEEKELFVKELKSKNGDS
jgi:hypothetical protein